MVAITTVAPATEPNVAVLVSTSQSGYKYCIMNVAQDLDAPVNGQQLAGTYYSRSTAVVPSPPNAVTITECDGAYQRTDDAWK